MKSNNYEGLQDNKEEIRLINIQMIASLLFIGTIVINTLLSYNERLQLENNPPLFDNDVQRQISLYNKIIILVLALTYFGIDIKNVEVSEEKRKDATSQKRQIFPAFLAILASLIILYNEKRNTTGGISQIENPTL